MKSLVPMAAASLLVACDFAPSKVCVTAAAPSIRLPAVPGRPGAGYFELDASPGQGDLLSVSSPRIERIEIHQSTTVNGVTTMRRIDRIAADGCNRFTTAEGRHLMLFGLDPSLRPGAEVPLILTFEHGPPQTIFPRVVAAGQEQAH